MAMPDECIRKRASSSAEANFLRSIQQSVLGKWRNSDFINFWTIKSKAKEMSQFYDLQVNLVLLKKRNFRKLVDESQPFMINC